LKKSRFLLAIETIHKKAEHVDITLGEIVALFGERGHSIIILFFCLPFLQPVPLPGLSTPFGVLIAIVSFLLYLHKPPWIPRKLRSIRVPHKILLVITEVAHKIWDKVEWLLSPRLYFLQKGGWRLLNFLLIAGNGILLALPLPIPFSNMIPALAILVNSFGQLEEDGVAIFVSYVIGFFSMLYFGGIFAGVSGTAVYFFRSLGA
jgi:hypothetical protein